MGKFTLMDHRVAAVISMMRQSLADRHLVKILSKRVNISPSRLRQLFKKETDRSPMQYLRGLRLEHAERLLGSTFLSVKEIAFVTGVKDVSNFVRCFKRWQGVTPKEFRTRARTAIGSSTDNKTNAE
jgi:transcriptional regulator GlxA family with amidase domain